jgi:hypothetical protein
VFVKIPEEFEFRRRRPDEEDRIGSSSVRATSLKNWRASAEWSIAAPRPCEWR